MEPLNLLSRDRVRGHLRAKDRSSQVLAALFRESRNQVQTQASWTRQPRRAAPQGPHGVGRAQVTVGEPAVAHRVVTTELDDKKLVGGSLGLS